MTEKPIIFTTDMVEAILSGKKTMTRRVIKYGDKKGQIKYNIPYQKGHILWVREKFRYSHGVFASTLEEELLKKPKVIYYTNDHPNYRDKDKWKPSIYMPRKAARIFLEVKAVRVERLQDITERDIMKEGLRMPSVMGQQIYTLQNEWIKLWDTINAKRGYAWESNPFVYVIEFERIRG